MRIFVCAIVAAIGLGAHPAFAQSDRTAATFWRSVQATCDATAAKPPGELGQRIAQIALDEFNRFGGHRIDSDGRLFRFGLTEAEHEEDDGGNPKAPLGHLGWWQVMRYWRVLFDENPYDKLEVRAYRDASGSTQETHSAELLRASAEQLLLLADNVSDPEAREFLREAVLRGAVIDTSWSAAFISFVVRQAGVTSTAFPFSNAHRAYIYDAFATSAAELKNNPTEGIYRACPLTTAPRVGDMICEHRESSLAGLSDEAIRERVRGEIETGTEARTIRRTHCEIVAHVDGPARKVYTIGGNVNQAVAARKLNLRDDFKFSGWQKGHCGGPGQWTLPQPAAQASQAPRKCALNDKKWFVVLQLR